MSIVAWAIVGAIAGLLAKAVVPGEGPGGLTGDLVAGVVGAIVGGSIVNAFRSVGAIGPDMWSAFVALAGAVFLLVLLRAIGGRQTVA